MIIDTIKLITVPKPNKRDLEDKIKCSNDKKKELIYDMWTPVPCSWNISDKSHCNAITQQAAWDIVADELEETGENLE